MTEKTKQPQMSDVYFEKVLKKIEAAQASNDIPMSYTFMFEGKQFVLTLPRSVMAQKRLVYMRNQMLSSGSFEAEEAFISAITDNITLNGQPLNINDLEYGEIEVLKTAYMDELLLPLSLGGDKMVGKYMKQIVGLK